MADIKKVKGSLLWSFCEDLVEQKAGYVWGGRGKVYNEEERKFLYNSFKSSTYGYTYYFITQWKRWKNHIVCDCSGMIEAFRNKYVDKVDMTADGLYRSCIKSGTIDTLPKNLRGVLLFVKNSNNSRMGHVGVYGGNNQTIEAMNDVKGVVKCNSISKQWTHWGIPAWLEPVNLKPTNTTITKTQYSVTASHLNVRNKPTTDGSNILKVLNKNDVVTEYGRNGNWIKIDQLKEMWTSVNYLKKIESKSNVNNTKYTVTAYHLNVRNKPTANGSVIIKVLNKNDVVTEYGRNGNWIKIDQNKELWVSASYLTKKI